MIMRDKTTLPPVPDRDTPMDFPPPYTPDPERNASIGSRGVPGPKIIAPAASVSQIHLFSNKEDIVGTFHIDPSTPVHGKGPTIKTRNGSWKKGKGKKKGHKADCFPHASFQSRSGDMKLQLGSTVCADGAGCVSGERQERANIFVGTRKGKVEVTLLPRDAVTPGGMTRRQPYIGLDVFSRSGEVIVYLPETFSGVVRVESVKGEMRLLPALAGAMRVLKNTDREMMLTVGGGEGDVCEIYTRKGRITVGVAGRDVLREETGFWRRLFGCSK